MAALRPTEKKRGWKAAASQRHPLHFVSDSSPRDEDSEREAHTESRTKRPPPKGERMPSAGAGSGAAPLLHALVSGRHSPTRQSHHVKGAGGRESSKRAAASHAPAIRVQVQSMCTINGFGHCGVKVGFSLENCSGFGTCVIPSGESAEQRLSVYVFLARAFTERVTRQIFLHAQHRQYDQYGRWSQ